MADIAAAGREFIRLLGIQERLRSPGGCPWDRQQTKEDILKYLLAEAYELADAVADNSPGSIREELGDLLYQILFISSIAEEEGDFDLAGVLGDIAAKMIRRHPHVFESLKVNSIAEINSNWVRIKNEKENNHQTTGFFDRIPRSQPALARAQKVTERAANVGFDWKSRVEILEKIEEELNELKRVVRLDERDSLAKEAGDLMFSVMNFCRFIGVDAEKTLHETTSRFIARFNYIEEKLAGEGNTLEAASVDEMNRLWEEAKAVGLGG